MASLLPLALVLSCSDPQDVGRHDPGTDTADTTVPPDTGERPEPWSFVVFGDNQFATESCTSGVDERLAIPQAVLTLVPDLVLSTGDLMDHGYDDGSYEKLESCYADMLARLPFFPTTGNHDMGSGGIDNYEVYLERQLFTTNAGVWSGTYTDDVTIGYEDDPNTYSEDPSNPSHSDDVPSGFSFETFYAVKVKNAVIISFEQGTRWWSNTPRSWLESKLAAARADPEVQHIFVIMHHPMYSTTMAEDSDSECYGPVRGYYEALFRQYDVTVAFSGHAHVYEHFYVPDDDTATRADPPPSTYDRSVDAIHYIVTGGGGGPLPSCDPMGAPIEESSANFLQGRGCGYHVTHVTVTGPRLTVEIVGVAGDETSQTLTTWDTFEVE